MSILLAYSTNAYVRCGLDEALRRVRALGFDGIEILADAPHAFFDKPSAEAEAAGMAVARQCRALGLTITNINANTARGLEHAPGGGPADPAGPPGPTLLESDPARRGARRAHLAASLRFAASAGAPCLSVSSGALPDGLSPTEAVRRLAESLAWLLREAASAGLRIGLEFEPGHFISSAAEAAPWLERFPSPAFGLNLDVGHAVVAGEDPMALVRKWAPRVFNMHLEDIHGRVHHHLVPGEGEINFEALAGACRDTGCAAPWTVELYTCADQPDRAGGRARERLRRALGAVNPAIHGKDAFE